MKNILALVVASVALSGCGVYFTNFKVENRSDQAMTNVQLVYLDGHFAMGTLRRGMARRFFGRLDRGETFRVEFDWRGKRRSVVGCYYDVTGSSGGMILMNDRLELTCDGHKRVKSEVCENKPDVRRLHRSTAADALPQPSCP